MIEWTSLSNEPLLFENYIPAGFAGTNMPGAIIHTAKGKFGRLTFQNVVNKDFCFQYSVLDLMTPLSMMVSCSLKGLYVRIVLENHISHVIKNADEILIREGQFSLALANALEAKIEHPRAMGYTSFDACFSMEMVRRMLPSYPGVAIKFQDEISTEPNILLSVPIVAGAATELLIDTLLHEPGNEKHAELLLANLFHRLENSQGTVSPGKEVLDNIYAVEELIARNIREHYLLPELAKRANTNQFYLKRYFPWIFGITPHKYLVRLRMRQAKRLLKAGYSSKATARECGYPSTAQFSRAFKKFFGLSPDQFLNNS